MDPHRIEAVEAILRDWIADTDIIIICGRWGDGSIMELVPAGRARLASARYEGRFAGLRDLELDGSGHHLHLDLARLTHAAYVMAPSVCFGYRPSFELRFAGDAAAARDRYGFSLALRRPYRGKALEHEAVTRYFTRYAGHCRRYPDVVSFRADLQPPAGETVSAFDWKALNACLAAAGDEGAAVASGEELERRLSAVPAAALQ